MPWLKVQPANRAVNLPAGTLLVDGIRKLGVPIASACGAHGLCARCAVEVRGSKTALTQERSDEVEAKRRNRVPAGRRLACRARVLGDLEVTTTYW